MGKINIQDRVKGIIKNMKYINTNIKNLDLTKLIYMTKYIVALNIKWYTKYRQKYCRKGKVSDYGQRQDYKATRSRDKKIKKRNRAIKKTERR